MRERELKINRWYQPFDNDSSEEDDARTRFLVTIAQYKPTAGMISRCDKLPLQAQGELGKLLRVII